MRAGRSICCSALASLLLVLVVATRAGAAGVGLRWNQCFADGGAINRSFACDTNVGVFFLVSSFVPGQAISKVGHVDVSLELASSSPVLPAWWQLKSCRANARAVVTSQVSVPISCAVFSNALGFNAIVTGERGPNTERIDLGSSAAPFGKDVVADQEYLAASLRMTAVLTVGAGSCEGCATPVCIVLRSVSLTRVGSSSPEIVLTQPLNGTDSNFVTWQGGGSPVVGGLIGCPAATSVHRSAWGTVKALYR